MKKKEIYILISIILIAVLGIIGLNIVKNKKQPAKKDESTAETTPTPSTELNTDTDSLGVPSEKPIGIWVGIVHRGKVVQWFDSGIDGEYVVKGNVGEVHVEVKDKKWHVREVDCPNQLCVKMGWADENSIIPITCLPNDVFIGSANLLSEYIGVK
ncbi:NusG domain II-containing protein [Solobacterium moorei]|uniref:NusG domain II-containing protein n=1 Tax=Solobacterium moorei TaxID=102148 RepID=UPI0004027FCF|nr:NusG domain II-containing protein [Solobacterium moorei]BET21206.1 hypothetical protein RGT18_07940 [Solobacterium moorei]